jgi:hypothetical protein
VYLGRELPSLSGRYLCADYSTGNLWALQLPSDRASKATSRLLGTWSRSITTFGRAANGEIFAGDFSSGEVVKLISRKPSRRARASSSCLTRVDAAVAGSQTWVAGSASRAATTAECAPMCLGASRLEASRTSFGDCCRNGPVSERQRWKTTLLPARRINFARPWGTSLECTSRGLATR